MVKEKREQDSQDSFSFFFFLVCILEMWFVILESKSWSNENK